MSLKQATVAEVIESREDLQICYVKLDASGEHITAYNYLALGPGIAPEQRVLINTTGIDLSLGTGGVGFVVPGEICRNDNQYGHIVKLRYTPLQTAVDSIEEQASPFHELLQDAKSIQGMPVVCCELHSQMPLVAAALKQEEPHVTVAYIMTDTAALPMAMSELVQQCVNVGLIDKTISCGQAFGGEHEAINLYSALLAACVVCKADVAIVAPGPGIVGSGTAFGHSGVSQGEALNAVAVLNGKPIAPLRLSWKDARSRHHALSHHSIIALNEVCLCRAHIPLPDNLNDLQRSELIEQLETSEILKKHHMVPITYEFDTISTREITVTTMGRTRNEDPAFFSASFAAGVYAALDVRTQRHTSQQQIHGHS